MTSFAKPRDSIEDNLLTPQNAAVVIIDFQPVQVASIASRPKRELVANITALAKIAKLYDMPVVLSTVNVNTGRNQPTIHQITDVLSNVKAIDRTSINAWEDEDFNRAVKATERPKLIMAALWTEVCLVHPALDAISEGFEVYPVIDCVGGTSYEAHDLGVKRLVQAGAKPVSWVQVICELQRDWNRESTVPGFSEILFTVAGH
jgi:nicotinamidase-related amidase